MKEKLEKLYDGLTERLKSSFLSTFIIIWLIHHWRLVFILFNFDPYYFLDSKIIKIENYIEHEGIFHLWVEPLIWTFISLLSFYCFSSLSEILYIAYHNVRKKIYKKWDNKKIKTIDEYLEKVEENEKLQQVVSDIEKRRDSLVTQNQRIEKEISQERVSNTVLSKQIIEKDIQLSTNEKAISTIEKEKEASKNRIIELVQENVKLKKDSSEYQKLKPKKTTDLKSVFGTSDWNLEFKNPEGKLVKEQFHLSSPNTFKVGQESIELTNIEFNQTEGIIEFYKNNFNRNYKNRYTKIIIANPDYLFGIEENGKVTYTRAMSTPNTIKVLSAAYIWNDGQTDVTTQIQNLVSKGIFNGLVHYSTFGIDDPRPNIKKTLKIHLINREQENELFFDDGETFNLNVYQ